MEGVAYIDIETYLVKKIDTFINTKALMVSDIQEADVYE